MSVGAVNKQTGDRIPTAGMPAIDAALSGSSTNPVQNMVVKAALDEKADTDIVASDFSSAASYTAGNYCIYEGKFYKFKNNHTGAWAAADVDEIKIAGELSSLKSGLTNIQNQSGEVASGIIDANGSVDIQLPDGVAAYLLCTYRDNDYFAGLYYLTYKVGGKITSSPILSSTNITVTGDLSDRHITIANGSNYPCCYAIKNLAHGY